MATKRLDLTRLLTPDTSGDVFPALSSAYDTNDRFPHEIWAFRDTSTKVSLTGKFTIPKDFVGSPKIILVWTSTVTTGNVVWDVEYAPIGGNDAESFDPSADTETDTVTDAAPGAASRRLETSVDWTAGNLAVDDDVLVKVSRDGADAADTLAGVAQLRGIFFEYVDV